MRKNLSAIHAAAISACASRGWLIAENLRIPCTLGRNGRAALKREGDGRTPMGILKLRRLFFRPDRVGRMATGPGMEPMRPRHGWCDDARDRNYNRPVALPYPAGHEEMWRRDGLYDVVAILGWNERPRRRNGGSAIFFHLAAPDGRATAGCIAISLADMRRLLPRLSRQVRFIVR